MNNPHQLGTAEEHHLHWPELQLRTPSANPPSYWHKLLPMQPHWGRSEQGRKRVEEVSATPGRQLKWGGPFEVGSGSQWQDKGTYLSLLHVWILQSWWTWIIQILGLCRSCCRAPVSRAYLTLVLVCPLPFIFTAGPTTTGRQQHCWWQWTGHSVPVLRYLADKGT